MAAKWEALDQYLYNIAALGQTFNAAALAQDLGISHQQASGLIQSYLSAQRGVRSQTTYVLHRKGRTRSAMWQVGERVKDVKAIAAQCFDDMMVKVQDALEPDLRRVTAINPRAAQLCQGYVQVFEANMNLLAASL